MNRKLKITLFTILGFITTVIAVVGGYFVYLVTAYHRIDDNLNLEVTAKGQVKDFISTDMEYSILSYNIGYGALISDYSFFMDGGKESKARDEKDLIANVAGIAEQIKQANVDIVMIQEVDVDATRTFGFNEVEDLETKLDFGNYVYAQNYDSPFLFYPVLDPIGASESGILTGSKFKITDSLRRQLPISTGFSKFFDLDRCFSISRIPVSNGKELAVYNLHLSAYGSNPAIREQQLNTLIGEINKDLEKGNYVICGGDFNHNLRIDSDGSKAPDWAQPFPHNVLPEKTAFGFSVSNNTDIEVDSCRNNDAAYKKGTTFTVLLDGMIVSDNVEVELYQVLDFEFVRSDHNPVYMKFKLKNLETEKKAEVKDEKKTEVKKTETKKTDNKKEEKKTEKKRSK